ncbi:MAG: TonB-dependent receptor, partial [Bacteroidota bacterium]
MKEACLLALFLPLWTFAQTGQFGGRITDVQTGEPLIGATVQLEGTNLGTVTDFDGFYLLENVPPQTYNITSTYLGYVSLTKYNLVIRSEGNIDVNFALTTDAVQLEGVVVTPNPFEKDRATPLSIQKLSQEEVAAYPGGNNDIAKVVQSLPGVSGSVGGFRNDVIIRGGAPNENVYYLDGVEIPNINHFATQGSAGGPVGLLNVSFFEGVTLTTSSFGSDYDNVLSGVLQFDQRRGNNRRFGGNFRLGASETALTLEGPLFKGDKERSNTTFIVSARRSYLQFLFQLIGLPFLPDYWDYQYKLSHRIDDYNELIFTGVGSIDDFAVNALEEFDEAQQAIQDQVPVIRQQSNALGLTWKKRFKDNSGLMQTTISSNVLNNEFLRYADNVNQTGLFFTNDSRERETKLRYKLSNFWGKWTSSYGFSTQLVQYQNTTVDFVNKFDYQNQLDFVRYGLFAQASTRLDSERLGLAIGLRMDGNTFTDKGNQIYRTLSPRLALSYDLTGSGKWTANASVGRYFKIPPYTILGFTNNDGVAVNQNTDYIRSDHLVAGVEYLVSKAARVTVEGFVKLYDNYP